VLSLDTRLWLGALQQAQTFEAGKDRVGRGHTLLAVLTIIFRLPHLAVQRSWLRALPRVPAAQARLEDCRGHSVQVAHAQQGSTVACCQEAPGRAGEAAVQGSPLGADLQSECGRWSAAIASAHVPGTVDWEGECGACSGKITPVTVPEPVDLQSECGRRSGMSTSGTVPEAGEDSGARKPPLGTDQWSGGQAPTVAKV